MIQVKGYNHVGIVVTDLDKSRWFYGRVLGLTSIDRPPFAFPGHWYAVGATLQLHLMVKDEIIPDTARHVALEVTDIQQALVDLKANAVEIVSGPNKREDGSDYLFCMDPEGNLVELTANTARL